MTMALQDAERQARGIIAGAATSPKEVLGLEKVLRGGRRFGLARKILERIRDKPGHLARYEAVTEGRAEARALHLQGRRSSGRAEAG